MLLERTLVVRGESSLRSHPGGRQSSRSSDAVALEDCQFPTDESVTLVPVFSLNTKH